MFNKYIAADQLIKMTLKQNIRLIIEKGIKT